MWRTTIRGLVARRLRLALTGVAVVLGVAFVSGTLVLTDTISHTFDSLYAKAGAGTDLSIRTKAPFTGLTADRAAVPAGVLATVAGVPGVDRAAGTVVGFAQVIGADGNVVGGNGATVGAAWLPDGFSPLDVKSGRPPAAAGEVVLDAATAKRTGFGVGSRVRLLLQGPPEEFAVVGVAGLGPVDGVGTGTFVAFEPATAHRVLGRPGRFDSIEVQAAPGTGLDALQARIAAALPRDLEVVTGTQVSDESAKKVKDSLRFLPTALLSFAGIALFVGAFMIANTFSVLVAQRSRELALLRSVGASRRQVRTSVVAEAAVTGLVASVVGTGLGVLVAVGLHGLLDRFGLELPGSTPQLRVRPAVVSVAVGTIVTTVSALLPAVRASRVAPMEALRTAEPGSTPPRRVRVIAAVLVGTVGAALLVSGLTAGEASAYSTVAFGTLVSLVALALAAPAIAGPLARVIGWPLALAGGVPGRLGRGNAMRNPRRTAATAASLTICLGLVSFLTVFAGSARASLHRVLDEGQRADYLVYSANGTGFSPELAASLRRRPEAQHVVGFRRGQFLLGDVRRDVMAADPAGLSAVLELDVRAGSAAQLADGGVAVHTDVAAEHGWRVGDLITMKFARSGEQRVQIDALFAEKRVLGASYLIAMRDFERSFSEQLDQLVLVGAAPGVDAAELRHAVEHAVAAYPGVEAKTGPEAKRDQTRQIDKLLGLVGALLALAIVIAVLGIVNTLALSVYERTREIGLVRAVGLSRRQLRSTVRVESVIIAALGAVLGVAVGAGFGAAMITVLRTKGMTDLSLPVDRLGIEMAAAVLAGVLAAAWPARRAARLDVLEAIGYE
ncbi:MAG TPA: FtsX-like permease family protein [Mycobacteriales bacterium]|nr:FtsX-like permease family protein [Mycobacteriales bacterium]